MYMDNLYKWLVYVGLDVLTLRGWSRRGSSSFSPTITMCHWIAGPRNVRPPQRPSLHVIRDGRAGLPGPLANDYMGRAGEAVLVAAGRANHAGYGYWKGVTGNTGAMGTEPEAADNSDWTEEQRKSYPLIKIAHLFAMWEKGLITWDQIASNRVVGHSEYALPKGRKIDINGYTMTSMRAQIAALIPGFKKRVNGKPIKVGTAPVFDRDTYTFTDGVQAPTPVSTSSKPKGLTVSEANRIIKHIDARTTITLDDGAQKNLHTNKDKWSLSQFGSLLGNRIGRTDGRVNDINNKVGEIYLLELSDAQMRALGTGIKQWTLPKLITTLAHRAGYTFQRTATLRGEVEGLKEMVTQLATGQGVPIDYDRVQEAAKAGAKEALEEGIDIEAEAEVTFSTGDPE